MVPAALNAGMTTEITRSGVRSGRFRADGTHLRAPGSMWRRRVATVGSALVGLIRRGPRQRSWGEPDVLVCFVDQSGYSDAGEAAALDAVGDRLDGARVLDLGVGTGRTTALLFSRAGRYLGVDVTPE